MLHARLREVRDRIGRAATRAGRDPASVRLIAVSKTFDDRYVRAAAEAGQMDFGENKVQEALDKMDRTRDLHVRWHLIGHLQTNKAKKAGATFDLIHSIDSVDLLRKVDDAAAAAGRSPEVLVQVDLAGEATKHGAREEDAQAIFRAAAGCKAARVVGLMLLPPMVEDPNSARPYFRALQQVRERLLAAGVDGAMLNELSMGMSHDFEVAIEEGATQVRVGTAIFGTRTYL
ncbi:MAG: YggS family pyridoxal phosphate-dependent enzyme [Acidobacteria bacterium]|nr:YggS family pyridoxal phosphate-dependent enzyme [Acidobacteriota bacterium]